MKNFKNAFAKSFSVLVIVVLMVTAMSPVLAAGATYSFSTDSINGVQGYNGWEYLYQNRQTQTLTQMEQFEYGFYWSSSVDTQCAISTTWFMPGSTSDPVLKWTAPQDGVIKITNESGKPCLQSAISGTQDGVTLQVTKNSESLYSQLINDTTGVDFSVLCEIKSGDIIDITVSANANADNDATTLLPVITYGYEDEYYTYPDTYSFYNDTLNITQGYDGWMYYSKSRETGAYTQLTPDGWRMMGDGGTTTVSSYRWWVGVGNPVAEWTATKKGFVKISTDVNIHPYEATVPADWDGVTAKVYQNGELKKSALVQNATGSAMELYLELVRGDKLVFELDPNSTTVWDDVVFNPTIAYGYEDEYYNTIPNTYSFYNDTLNITQGYDGWMYYSKSRDTGAYTALTPDGWRMMGDGGTTTVSSYRWWVGAGNPVAEWTAAKSGFVKISTDGNIRPYEATVPADWDGVTAKVYQNGELKKSVTVNLSTGAAVELYLNLTRGDKVTFELDPNGSSVLDDVVFNPVIGYGYEDEYYSNFPNEYKFSSAAVNSVQGYDGWRYYLYSRETGTKTEMVKNDWCWSEAAGSSNTVLSQYQWWPGSYSPYAEWTATKSGVVKIGSEGNVYLLNDITGTSYDGVAVIVTVNGTQVFNSVVANTTGVPISAAATVKAGDIVGFMLSPNSSTVADNTMLLPVITYLPEIKITKDGATATATVSIDENTAASAVLVIATYLNGRLISMNTNEKTVSGKTEFAAQVTVGDGEQVKAMLWNGWGSLTPLTVSQ